MQENFTDMLKFHNPRQRLKVTRIMCMGIGNKEKGTLQGVKYFLVATSLRYGKKTGIHTISMVPEIYLHPLKKAEK